MEFYRITLPQFAGDLSGTGAKKYGGRWNSEGIYMVYASEHVSLAILELACNSGDLMNLQPLKLTCIEISEEAKILKISRDALPENWHVHPSPDACKAIGDNFINGYKALALKVPSAISKFEYNVLLNPLHPDFFKKVKIKWVEDIILDKRMIGKP